jgi:hypothetical protein
MMVTTMIMAAMVVEIAAVTADTKSLEKIKFKASSIQNRRGLFYGGVVNACPWCEYLAT